MQIDELLKAKKNLNEKNELLNNKNDSLTERIDSLSGEMENLKQQLGSKDQEINNYKIEQQNNTFEIKTLRQKIDLKPTESQNIDQLEVKYEKDLDLSLKEIEKLKSDLEKVQNEVVKYKSLNSH